MGWDDVVYKAIRDWRDSLINLTGKNRLLNFKPDKSKTSTVEIVRPDASAVLDRLRARDALRFRSIAPRRDSQTGEVLPEPPPASDILDTRKDEAGLTTALRNLMRRSNQEYLDRGLWVLYLVFGTLQWKDVDGSPYTSPLLLVPVQLTSPGPRQTPVLKAADEDSVVNPALALKMSQFGVPMPTVDLLEDLSLQGLLDELRRAVSGKAGWGVRDEVFLSYFSFSKEAMYRDLLEHEDRIAAHPIIRALATGGRGGETGDFWFDEIPDERIDADAPPEETPLVLDADSSQRACIAAAVAGRSFVMDGPPGTGKSQTIANMIGALLHAGKSVLFVSEKAAALEVVRDRLTDVGLGAYLLELHSHKATRKEVATALGAALENEPVAPAAMSALDLDKARKRREELNAYAAAMNEPRPPLGYSLHQVLGMIAQLHDVPVAPATGIAPVNLTVELFGRIRETARSLARAWRPAAQGASFVWRGVIERASMDACLYQADAALEALSGLAGRNAEVAEAFGLTRPSDAEKLAAVLDHLAARPAGVPDAWLRADTLDPVRATVSRLAADLAAVAEAEDAATETAGVPWAALPKSDDLPAPDVAQLRPLTPAPVRVDELTADTAKRLAETFHADAERLERCLGSLRGIAAMLGLPPVETYAHACDTLAVAGLGYAPNRPERAWLSPAGLEAAQAAADALRHATAQLDAAETAARAYYTDAALDADVEGLAERFTTLHKGLRKLRSQYRADKRAVAAFTADGVSQDDALGHLDKAVAWKHAVQALAETEAAHAVTLGSYYTGRTTDFDALAQAIANAETALRRARTSDLARLADHVARDATPSPTLRQVAEETRAALEDWRARLVPEPVPAGRPELLELPIEAAVAWLRAHCGPLHAAADLARGMSQAVGRTLTVGEAQHLLTLRAAVDAAHAALDDRAPAYADVCLELFDGRRTDITAVRAALTWTEQARSLLTGADAPFTAEQVKALGNLVATPSLADAARAWVRAKDALLAAFEPARRAELASELDDYADGADLIDALRQDAGGQDEWFAYTEARAVLAEHGLDVAVEFCIAERVPAEQVPKVIERALLREWADYHLMHDPALKSVRAEDRNALVREYRELDKRLVTTAVSSIITAVNSRRPRNNLGESAIISREAGKKKKHMPVRLLLERTRHVVQAIKPCFMMSPLAVSQYLPPDLTFDVVIFDEASQVSPGDAINCIYRGRALILAGDQKQLPPTAFFLGSTDDGGDEWSEEDENAKDFESILDLAKASGAFKSLTLRWHYRSRHESLITFSNASFYDGKLITFPGAEDDGPDVGVELFKVDGVYRRGTTRDNPVEAAKVAERVIHHFDTRPDLTLGVVTFSEQQAAAIEDAIERARQDRPDLDRFFTEDRLRGFFVKSLESVQGDERDVMIFSIGYGPDEHGKITMNFGPLNRPGGWRRLNVAITRARYRNEIVSSITAAQIDAASKNEGVRHLRRYLDYAARGIPALGLDLAPGGDAESPFEESVIAAIRSWGYDVTPQVGAAGYRIDIGVHHPDHPGVYVLGVECDGLMYHSSKAARDRDRLREQVLRGLGWRLHRIWGTAWYRDRRGEEDRLKAAIEAAVAMPVRGLLSDGDGDDFARPVVTVKAAVSTDRPAWTVPYRVARVDPLPRWIDPSDPAARYEMRVGIAHIAAVEAPVHITVIHQRLREAWSIGRVGARIRENIDAAIRLAGLIRDGDFVLQPDSGTTVVRTPVPDCARTVEQVHDDELGAALVNLVRDAGGISHDDLTAAVARLYGWNRRGSDITARLDGLIAKLLADGTFTGGPESLALGA
ncbi:Uncharacterized protein LI90_660 [Carbonactinospora thermoautotrophica]|uniref:Uncharacterized protein n=1 Tax=Carbonactinospora thermoautotrophica TaxID=1469144 RepID=A0A132MMF6_9ACTN|nr:Uncharacterized protein LI90_660 [Carbonactinospora thermoautotrophica]